MRRFLVRLTRRSAWDWHDALNDLRWDHGIDTLSQAWRAGPGRAVVARALGALGLADSVVEVARTS